MVTVLTVVFFVVVLLGFYVIDVERVAIPLNQMLFVVNTGY
jgi:hypothetical protein